MSLLDKPLGRSKTKEGKIRDTVAIIGFAGTTRHLAPYDDDTVECWGLNEAHRQPWMKRITRWFQLHKRWDFTKANNDAYREHWEWLQQEHPFPIYMQKVHDDIPSSVKYPLEEISEKFLSKVIRANGNGVKRNDYFTSSFAYLCALALYMGFKRIEIYGWEMATDTEYRYQKGSTEYFLGIATGMGVEVYIPEVCQLLSGELYGWRVSRMINRQRLEFLHKNFKRRMEVARVQMDQVNGRRQEAELAFRSAKDPNEKKVYAGRNRELLEAEINSSNKTHFEGGRVKMLEDLMKIVDNMHAGKDDWTGPDADLDMEEEDRVQAEAEAKAEG